MNTHHRTSLFCASALLLGAGLWLALAPAPDRTPHVLVASSDAGEHGGIGDLEPASPQAQRTAVLGHYGAPAGRVIELALDATMSTAIASTKPAEPGAGATTAPGARFDLRGTAEVTVLAHREGELVFAFRVADASVSATTGDHSAATDAFSAALAEPALVKMTEHGAVLGYRFPSAWGAEMRNLTRSLVASHRFATPPNATRVWTCDEDDAAGRASVEYSVTAEAPLAVARKKVAYRGNAEFLPAVDAEGEARFDATIGWIAGSRSRDALAITIEDYGYRITSTSEVAFAFAATRDVAVDVPADLWTAPWAATTGGDDTPELSRRVLGLSKDDVASDTVASLVAEIEALAALRGEERKGLIGLRNRLVALIAFDPRLLDEMRTRLCDPSLGDDLASVLMSALGAVGTPEAQAILHGIATDATATKTRRVFAVQSAFQVERATEALLSSLDGMVVDGASDLDVAGVSLQALGAFADAERADSDPRRFAQLLGMEQVAGERGLLLHWLDALGNSRQPAIIDPVRRHLDATDVATRAAAVNALFGLHTDEATSMLAAAATDDAAPSVRSTAVAILFDRRDDVARATIEHALLNDANERVRRVAILGLGRQLGSAPDAERLLSMAAASDADPELRRLAADMLTGPSH